MNPDRTSRCGNYLDPWRRLARRLVAIATLVGSTGVLAQGSWTTLGPAGGTVSALLASPGSATTLYAGTPTNGVFVSTDAGGSWHPANAGLTPTTTGRQKVIAVQALTTDSQYIYAVTDAGLYYAAAGAAPNWTALAATGATAPIATLVYEPSTGLLVAAPAVSDGVSLPGVYLAPSVRAAGAPGAWTFVPLPAATAGRAVGGVAVTPPGAQSGAGPAALLVGTGQNLYSALLSATAPYVTAWNDADPTGTLAAGSVTALTWSADFQLAYACSGAALFYSGNVLDAQAVWSLATLPASDMAGVACAGYTSVPVAAGGAPQLMLATDQGALVSTDGTMFASTGPLGLGLAASAFAIAQAPGSSDNALYAASGFGVSSVSLATLQAGAAWTPRNGATPAPGSSTPARLDNTNVIDTAVLGTTLYAAASDAQYAEVLASADGGLTWTPTGIGSVLATGEVIIALLADDTNAVLYAATSSGLLAFAPATHAWTPVGAPAIGGRVGALALGATNVFVGTDDGVLALPRGAAPASASPVAGGLAGTSVRSLLLANGLLLAASIDASDVNTVWFTSESTAAAGAAAWQMFGIAPTGIDRITAMLLLGTNLLVSTNGGLVLYGSAGSTWSSANTSSDPAQQIADPFGAVNALYTDGATIYAATGSQGVFASPLQGNVFTWSPLDGVAPAALPSMEVHALRAASGVLYASTRGGVAAYALPSAASAPASAPSSGGTGGGTGGGAFSTALGALLLLAGVLLPRRSRARN